MSSRSLIESACSNGDSVALDENKELVRRLIEEAVNERNLDAVDELADSELAIAAKRWIGPFRISFPDFTMKIVGLVGEGDTSSDTSNALGRTAVSGTASSPQAGASRTSMRSTSFVSVREADCCGRGRGQPDTPAAARLRAQAR
jgi:hypothetical protein